MLLYSCFTHDKIFDKFKFDKFYTWSDGFTLQLYLLGLPNKLGPLGFLALHHVLTEEEEADVAKVNTK